MIFRRIDKGSFIKNFVLAVKSQNLNDFFKFHKFLKETKILSL